MPFCYRVVYRRATDPHGCAGYYIHRIGYREEDQRITSWTAGVSLHGDTPEKLIDHFFKCAEAFYYPVIAYADLQNKDYKLPLTPLPKPIVDIAVTTSKLIQLEKA